MRVSLWLFLLCAVGSCRHGSARTAPLAGAASRAPVTAIETTAPRQAATTEAELIATTRALLDAYDRGDADRVASMLAPSFMHVEGGHLQTAGTLLASLRKRRPGAPFIASRAWEREHVEISADTAAFVGKATERQGGNDLKGGYKYVGWYLVQWVRQGTQWRATLWTWQRAGTEAAREEWNEIYRNGLGYTRKPNRVLVEIAQDLPPGQALDVATGQGRNALHLASRGWKVTGVDISDEGLRMAKEAATNARLSIETVNADLNEYDFGERRWDLVTMIYATDNVEWLRKAAKSLRPGGLIVVESFAKTEAQGGGFAAGQLASIFADGFVVLRDEVVEDVPDWAMDRATLVRFVARKR